MWPSIFCERTFKNWKLKSDNIGEKEKRSERKGIWAAYSTLFNKGKKFAGKLITTPKIFTWDRWRTSRMIEALWRKIIFIEINRISENTK